MEKPGILLTQVQPITRCWEDDRRFLCDLCYSRWQKHKRYWQEHTRYWEVSGIFEVFCWTCHQDLSGFLQLGHLSSVLNDGSLNHAVDQVRIVKLLQWQCSSRPASSWFSFSIVCVTPSLQQPIAVPCRITSLDLGNIHLPLLPLSPQYDHPGQQGFKNQLSISASPTISPNTTSIRF